MSFSTLVCFFTKHSQQVDNRARPILLNQQTSPSEYQDLLKIQVDRARSVAVRPIL